MNQLLKTRPAATFVDYLKDKNRYADFINYFLFAGHLFLNENHLFDYDSDSSTVFSDSYGIVSLGKSRDIIMGAKIENYSVLIGIEHQQTIDYSMPYRILMYDFISYNQQYNRLENNEKRYFHPIPIITFVLYSGERKWQKPRTFAELLSVPKCLEGVFNNWKTNVFDIKDIDVSKLHHPDNQKLVEAVQKVYQWNKDVNCLSDMVLSKEVAILVATIINQKELLEIIEKQEEQEEMNMCTVITEALLENWKRGELEGRKLGELEGRKLGELEGRKLGELEGRKLGELEGKRIGIMTTLISQLRSKLGALSIEVEKEIKQSTDEQLDLLAVHIFDVHSENDVLRLIS